MKESTIQKQKQLIDLRDKIMMDVNYLENAQRNGMPNTENIINAGYSMTLINAQQFIEGAKKLLKSN